MRHAEPLVRGYAVTHPAGEVRLPTQRGWTPVVYAVSGVLRAVTPGRSWIVPPHRALYVGDDVGIQVRTGRPTAVRCLYFDDSLAGVESGIRVLNVPPLLRELLLDAVRRSPLDVDDTVDAATVTLVLDLLNRQPGAPLELPMPRDDRARSLADAIVVDPALSIAAATHSGLASRRTFERLFRAETGMSLAGWQRRVRMLAAVGLLADGASVTAAATGVGYSTPSAFAAAFRSEMGAPPSAFLAAGAA